MWTRLFFHSSPVLQVHQLSFLSLSALSVQFWAWLDINQSLPAWVWSLDTKHTCHPPIKLCIWTSTSLLLMARSSCFSRMVVQAFSYRLFARVYSVKHPLTFHFLCLGTSRENHLPIPLWLCMRENDLSHVSKW